MDVGAISNSLLGLNQDGFTLTAEALNELQGQANSLVSSVTALQSGMAFPVDGNFLMMQDGSGAFVDFDATSTFARVRVGRGVIGVSGPAITAYVDATLAQTQTLFDNSSSVAINAVSGSNAAVFYTPAIQNVIRQDGFTVTAAAGNSMNGGQDFVNSLAGGVAGHTIWALGQSANKAVFRLSVGTGTGGWDGNGASIYGTAVDGFFRAGALVLGNAAGGNRLNAGLDFVTTLSGNIAGHTLWSLEQSAGVGVARICNGTGAGGFDANGAQFYVDGNSGNVLANTAKFQNGSPSISGNAVNIGGDFANSLVNNVAGATIWALAQSGNKAILRLSDGSGANGWDSNGAQIYGTASDGLFRAVSLALGNPTSGNRLNAGLDFINSLSGNVAGHTLWALAQSGGKGILRLSDGSGAGGIDGNGAYVYADGATLRANNVTVALGGTLDLTGVVIKAPNGAFGVTAASFTIHTITVSAGIVTAVT